MDMTEVYLGLDYHKRSVQVCVLDSEGKQLRNRRCDNDLASILSAIEPSWQVKGVALEACTGTADLAETLLTEADWPVCLAHAGYVAKMKRSPDKTDYGDSRVLADLMRVGWIPRVWLPPAYIREMRRMVRYRQQLVDERRNAKLRIGSLLRDHRIHEPDGFKRWSKPWYQWIVLFDGITQESRWIIEQHLTDINRLTKQIRSVEHRIEHLTKDDLVIAKLLNLTGVGPVTAWMLRAVIGQFDRFKSGKQLARFCGLSPRNASSGERQADSGLIKAGDPQLRAVLIQAAHRLGRCDPRWRAFHNQKLKAGKPGSVIAAAVANRWVRWLYHRMTEQEDTMIAA